MVIKADWLTNLHDLLANAPFTYTNSIKWCRNRDLKVL